MIKDNIVFCICDFETTGLDPIKDYPIEIGCIFTDNKFRKLGHYESLINWGREALIETEGNTHTPRREHLPALLVHQINPFDVIEQGKPPSAVVNQLAGQVNQYKPKTYGKVILLSDNIRFEWQFMQKLFGENLKVESLFHYAGWDVNLLLECAGIERPKTNKAHRALADCEGLAYALAGVREGIEIK